MVAETLALEAVLAQAKRLSARDQLRLVARLTDELAAAQPPPRRRPTYGALAHLGPGPSEEDIAEMRREAWAHFAEDPS